MVNALDTRIPLGVQAPDVGNALVQYDRGLMEGRENKRQNALMAVGQAAQGGNLAGARDAAFQGGLLNEGLALQGQISADQNAAASRGLAERRLALAESDSAFNKRMAMAEFGLKKLAAEYKAQGGFEDAKEEADVSAGLRKEYSGLSKDYRDVRDAYRRVEVSAEDPSAAGDVAMIFNYMKMLDPGSVVREGEFATAQNSGGVPDKIRATYNQVLEGTRLTPQIRADFLDRAGRLFTTQDAQHSKLVDEFTGISERLNLDPRNVVVDFTSASGGGNAKVNPSGGATGGVPQGAIDFLKSNANDPAVLEQFQQKYGQAPDEFLR